MTDAQLKSALIEVRDYMLDQLPTEEWNYEFSPKFQRKMKQIIELEKHPIWYYVRRVAAALLITLGISGGLVLSFSEEARANVIRWFMERFTENGYRYQNEMRIPVDIFQYSLEGKISDNYQLIDRIESGDTMHELFAEESGNMLIFNVMSSTLQEEYNLVFDKSMKVETVNVNGNQADLYLSESAEESNVIVWQGTNGVLFSITGMMEKEQLIELAEKIE
ncbi:MAG: DUF4367 domain-containing protein [Lachnospiraceae bacterium]|nr:DUF4367 domain-containing protein [Lachnospiraceae bacterium]MBR3508417.1 DUF4367 domain-containing protein [Lachnospiraceae bacterium]